MVFILVCSILFITTNCDTQAQISTINEGLAIINISNQSYNQITQEMVDFWDSTFIQLGIKDEPFAMMILFINLFSKLHYQKVEGYYTLSQIFSEKKSNLLSNAVSTVALMQRFGWDIQCFYNKSECYLGINFSDDWRIRKGNWIEKDGRRYYLKEFDTYTPVGELKMDNPASTYQGLESKRTSLKPIPLLKSLPKFSDMHCQKRKLKWLYNRIDYTIFVEIPIEQIEWTKNLPPSLFGMVSSGIIELKNIGLDEQLKPLINEIEEYDKVNFLLKFCQSESIFTYNNKLTIKSVSNQLIEGKNDCDGRTVFLYCLLYTVIGYSTEDIVFISWKNHLALGLRPKTENALKKLRNSGVCISDNYYILDPAYVGETYWGSKMKRLSGRYEIIQ